MSRPKVLSLFSGAGGLDIGFHQAGFDIIACVEWEAAFCKTLEQNREQYLSPECQIFNADIRDFDSSSLREQTIDLIIGGPPCQSFSAAGRRAGGASGLHDPRGTLFEHYCRVLTQLRPQAFVFENVRGLLGVNRGEAWKVIVREFSALGYQVTAKLLDSAAYGVPQHRDRIILVGSHLDNFRFPLPTHGPDSSNKVDYVTARQAIGDLDNDASIPPMSGRYGHLLPDIPPGGNYSYYTRELNHPNPVFAWRSKFSDFLYKADPDSPVKTIQAQPGKYSGPFHWRNRRMTIAEYKRLQTFPDDYVIVGNYNTQIRQIGNSVPPRFAYYIALAVTQQCFPSMQINEVALLSSGYQLSIDHHKRAKAVRTKRVTQSGKYSISPSEQQLGFDLQLESSSQKPIQPINNQIGAWVYGDYRQRRFLTDKKAFLSAPGERVFAYCLKPDGQKLHLQIEEEETACTGQWDITLQLTPSIYQGFHTLDCTLRSTRSTDAIVGWDVIQDVLTGCTTYHSLIDLHGHYAEPHPTFSAKVQYHGEHDLFARFLERLTNTPNVVAKSLAYASLAQEIGTDMELVDFVRWARYLRYDVRSHNTNISLPPGIVLICYYFPRAIDTVSSIKVVREGNMLETSSSEDMPFTEM